MLSRSKKIFIKNTFHFICFIFGITFIVSFFTQRKLKILLYHRVANHEKLTFTNPLRVRPTIFAKQMRYLRRKKYNIISLDEGIRLLQEKQNIPKNSIIITFDDGYNDNYSEAFPILQKYGVPASIFLTTDFINTGRMWYHEIEKSISNTNVKTISLNGNNYSLYTKKQKNELLNKLIKYFKSYDLEKGSVNEFVDDLCKRLNTQMNSINGLSLTWDQIKEMNKFNISFGSHCVNHIPCSVHSEEILKREIIESKKIIDEMLNQNTIAFAYPYGEEKDYDKKTIKFLKDNGFIYALAVGEDFNNHFTNQYKLKRISIRGDDSMIDFYNRLSGTGIDRVLNKLI